jgi:levanbiose-producing levanase
MLPSATRGIVQNIDVTLTPGTARRAGIVVRGAADASVGTRIVYDVVAQTLTLDRSASGETRFSDKFSKMHIARLPLVDGKLQMNIVVDRSSVEVFAQHGRVVITDLVFPSCSDDRVAVFAQGGTATFDTIEVTNLAWPAPSAQTAPPR